MAKKLDRGVARELRRHSSATALDLDQGVLSSELAAALTSARCVRVEWRTARVQFIGYRAIARDRSTRRHTGDHRGWMERPWIALR